jgi:mono/diheme cytochrome c family protein
MRRRALAVRVLALAVLIVASLTLLVVWLNVRDDGDGGRTEAPPMVGPAADGAAPMNAVARGEYLVRAGSCLGCHTDRGGAAYAGGRAIETPFGNLYSTNLTPDAKTGLGGWSAADFWRAMHHGRSRDGRLLYPAFPYPNYTRLARADTDAMFAYLQSLPPVAQAHRAHELRFPFDQRAALAVWRALFFRPGRFEAETSRSRQWNRGAYLVETLGHCNACHSRRNVFGATAGPLDLAGGLIPIQNWYAPSLNAREEAGVADWPAADVVALLKTGISARGSVQGPMAEVVAGSTQFLADADLAAMAAYLQALPVVPVRPAPGPRAVVTDRGARLYEEHCAGCHGARGEGVAGAYPPLAGNRAVAMTPSANLVHVVLRGGFPPTTPGNPRPFGMPPFATVLNDVDLAELLSTLRASWGHRAPEVSALEVSRYRGASAR